MAAFFFTVQTVLGPVNIDSSEDDDSEASVSVCSYNFNGEKNMT